MNVGIGAIVNSTVVEGNSNDYNSSTRLNINGGIVNYTVLSGRSAQMLVRWGMGEAGVANSTTVMSGGRVYIYSSSIANYTTVDSGGYICINRNGIASNTIINSKGFMIISSRGSANCHDASRRWRYAYCQAHLQRYCLPRHHLRCKRSFYLRN